MCSVVVVWRSSLWRSGVVGLSILLCQHVEAIALGKGGADLPGCAGSGLMEQC